MYRICAVFFKNSECFYRNLRTIIERRKRMTGGDGLERRKGRGRDPKEKRSGGLRSDGPLQQTFVVLL